jgi:hypothetical protein
LTFQDGVFFFCFCPVSSIFLQYCNLVSFSCVFFQSMISEVDVPAVASSISSFTKSGDIAKHSTYGMELTELQMVRINSWSMSRLTLVSVGIRLKPSASALFFPGRYLMLKS